MCKEPRYLQYELSRSRDLDIMRQRPSATGEQAIAKGNKRANKRASERIRHFFVALVFICMRCALFLDCG
jgi:hypothetical protein